jgi:hypothetical protein
MSASRQTFSHSLTALIKRLLTAKRLAPIVLGALLIILASASAKAVPTTINFEGGTPGTTISSFYSGMGVTFSNAQFVSSAGHFGSSSISFGALNGPTSSSPIVISFVDLQSEVTLTAVDLSREGFLMRAYDSSNNLLGYTGYLDGGSNGLAITFSTIFHVPRISYVELFQPLNTSGHSGGVLFDNLRFDDAEGLVPTPEPSSLILISTGLVGVAGRVRRRWKARTRR